MYYNEDKLIALNRKLLDAVENSNDVIVTDLLNQTIKTIVNSAAELAEEKGHVNVLKELLVQEVANKDKYLYRAVKKGSMEIVKLLLNQGVSTEYVIDRLTSIQLAIILKRTEIVKLLLDAGAKLYHDDTYDNAIIIAEAYNKDPVQKKIHKLVMDEYYKRIGKFNLNPNNGKSFTVVIARYNEDLSWIAKEFPTEQVIIYNKGPNDIGDLPDNCLVVNLPNIGRETHSYLYHIISNYNNLSDRILFIQGQPYDHRIYLPLVKHKVITDSSCKNTIAKCMYDSLANQSDGLEQENWQDSKWKDIVLSNKTMLEFTKYYIGQQYFGDTEIYFQWGGQFAVDKEKILCHEKKYFENLIATLNKQHPIEVHYIERLWDLIFSCESSPAKSTEIVIEAELSIPKIIHRIWMVWNPNKPEITPIYQEFDKILKNLHPDWQFMEWDDKKVLKLISDFYPDFLPTYLAYDVPVKRHDACRYFILDHFGGAFIQHSYKFQKNIEPLISNTDLVLTTDSKAGTSITNGFLASIPGHELWKTCIKQLVNTASLPTLDATGPHFLAKSLWSYVANNGEESLRILSRDYLLPFDWEEKFDPIINKNCIEDHSKCFELFPNAYSFSLWNWAWKDPAINTAKIDLASLYNSSQNYKIYIINLDNSVDRWNKVKNTLDKAGIKYERFSAVDGYKIKIKNLQTEEEFFGEDIKNKIAKIDKSLNYKITCNPESNLPTEFIYQGGLKKGISPGELGLWCSNKIIWDEAVQKSYKDVLILEDDIVIRTANLKKTIDDFAEHVPKSYDLAYLDVEQYQGKQYSLPGNNYVNGFDSNSAGYGTWSILYSNKGLKKLLSLGCYSYSIDDFIWSITRNTKYKRVECVNSDVTFEAYSSSIKILDTANENSIIGDMGRETWIGFE